MDMLFQPLTSPLERVCHETPFQASTATLFEPMVPASMQSAG